MQVRIEEAIHTTKLRHPEKPTYGEQNHGASFSVEYVLSCPKGGLPSLRHNEIRDLTANLLTEVCSLVCVEPKLQPVPNSEEFPFLPLILRRGHVWTLLQMDFG